VDKMRKNRVRWFGHVMGKDLEAVRTVLELSVKEE